MSQTRRDEALEGSLGLLAHGQSVPASGMGLSSILSVFDISREFFFKAAGTYLTQLFLAGVSLLTSVLVARLLGPAGRGEYAVALAVALVGVQFGNLGLHSSNTFYVSRNAALLPGLLANSLILGGAVGGIFSAVAGLVAIVRPAWMPTGGMVLALALCWVPVGVAYLLSQNLLVGMQEIRAFNTIEVGNKILALALIGVLFPLGRVSPGSLLAVAYGAMIFSLVRAVARLRRLNSGRLRPSWALFRTGIGLGLRIYAACFLSFLVLRIDLLMVKYMLGAQQAGYYSIASNMADFILLLPIAISTILFPKLAALTDEKRRWQIAARVVWGISALVLPVIVVSGLIARYAIEIAFGTAYLPALVPFVFLLPGVFCLAVESVAVQCLASVGFPLSVVVAWAVICILKISINFWAIPYLGMKGASISSTICYAMMLLIVLWIIHGKRKQAAVREPF